jgi:RNA polymerase-interacting CarD/CdnL/TRCF family regulator
MATNLIYPEGSWIVHVFYGVGQVIRLEKKHLEGKENLYYRVEGKDGTFWLPVNKADSERIRPVVSKEKMRSAIQALGEKPHRLIGNHIQRKSKIKEIQSTGSITSIACLVRDLTYQASEKKLSIPEQETLDSLKKRLAMEWSVVFEIKPKEAEKKLNALLEKV